MAWGTMMTGIGRNITIAFALAGAVAVGALLMAWRTPPPPPPVEAPLMSLEKMGRLVALRVNYADVIEFNQPRTQDIPLTQWALHLGGTRVLQVAKGDCTLAADLTAARYEQVDQSAKRLTVVLPPPQLMNARINHEPREKGGSYLYAVTSEGLEPLIPDSANRTAAINNSLVRAQEAIERLCRQPDMIATAQRNAEDILASLFRAAGWQASFQWTLPPVSAGTKSSP
jgi:hypothetical protein